VQLPPELIKEYASGAFSCRERRSAVLMKNAGVPVLYFRHWEIDLTTVRPGYTTDSEELYYCKMGMEINLVLHQLGICTQQSLTTGKHA